jgi:hypothetical protein
VVAQGASPGETIKRGSIVQVEVSKGAPAAAQASTGTETVSAPPSPARAVGGKYAVSFPDAIGAYRFVTHNRYADAKAVFGTPSGSHETGDGLCELAWNGLGLRLTFRSPSPAACSRVGLQRATWTAATLLSPKWSIDRGLRVGDSWARVKQLYPSLGKAMRGSPTWQLASRPVPLAHTQYINLVELDVVMRAGRISQFQLYYSG